MRTLSTLITMFALVIGLGCPTVVWGGNTVADEAAEVTPGQGQAADAGEHEAEDAGQDAEVDAVAPPSVLQYLPAVEPNRADPDGCGPTVLLSYGRGTPEKNSMQAFMYFIPLISPVPVDRAVSAGNCQQAAIVSYTRKITARSFSVTCQFEMSGGGSIRYTFDPTQMIALRIVESKKPKGQPLGNVLDYINFEGEGFGEIRVKGTVNGGFARVTEVHLEFNARGRRSPVTIGLYELKAKNGQYRYDNRSNQLIARVNSLIFKKGDDPKMDIAVASLTKKPGSNGFFGHLKAAIANMFIKPVQINPLGNETLLDFGGALLEQKTAFTFPKAANLKEMTVLAAQAKAK